MSTYYGYIRVSTLQQANDGDSLETQLKQINSYASLKGYDIPQENFITERGVSGSVEFEKRPEGLKLFEKLETGDVLIFSKLDRAFRNTRNALNTLHELKLRGVSVHFIDLGGDVTNDGIGSVIFTILSAFATFERERIATRIREVKQVQKADGKFLGGFTRFGYRVVEDRLEKDLEQQKIIKEMRDMKRRGMSLRRISSWLNKTHSVKMSHSTVSTYF
ncbi:recombinase family protein [Polynucleobacter sp. MWH-CaK5]|uniref:recombinase family protein n=1 Tax=Polynucleobacter sp. MWH-CaK5 TaxID=2689107 RepID=UPI001BFD883E|nr:recombinase family protein [Polynucleobacter sp. MWH-CaK5]QWD89232.1 recombinase family protein [Polynucleobacter sp. MWH-CaK5]